MFLSVATCKAVSRPLRWELALGADAFKMYLPSWSLKGSLRAFKKHSQDSEENKIHAVRFLYRFIGNLKGWLKVGGVRYPEGKEKKYEALGEEKKKGKKNSLL